MPTRIIDVGYNQYNTVAVLFNTRKNAPSLPILCKSRSRNGDVLHSEAKTEIVVHAPGQCQFTTFVARCATVMEPSEVALGIYPEALQKIPFSKANHQPRKLVVCMSRMYYFENWQLLFTSLQVYRHFGADLMVTYIESILANLNTILRAYEQEGFVMAKPGLRMFRAPGMPYDPNAESEWGNQLSVYNSCLFEFKESAEFMIFADWDDVFIPNNHPSYFEELRFAFHNHPTAAALVFPRINARVLVSDDPRAFNISYTYNTLHPLRSLGAGKYAAIPSLIKGSWVHWAASLADDRTQVFLRNTTSQFWHLRVWEKYVKVFERLPQQPVYYPALVECYDRIESKLSKLSYSKCPSSLDCTVPKLNVDCVNLHTSFKSEEWVAGVHWHQRTMNRLKVSPQGCQIEM
ncbi:hypothetical protein L596_004399 [Steinernema carpocapsae]|uniref:Glycosyltransferase family 92 protein n=1 Tax=Steinernema carpocapsae TaxID=34508 RepID=A0A4U8UVS9_STECR|nr:hypothetical protein L596_004399 [Steinernema carpocapsae]